MNAVNQPGHDPTESPLVVYGAGTHGRVVAEAARMAGWHVIGFIDDGRSDLIGLLDREDPRLAEAVWIVGIGNNTIRESITSSIEQKYVRAAGASDVDQKVHFAAVIHPTAFVSPSAQVGAGAFVGPNAIVHTNAQIGAGAVINSGAIVEHDCVVGPFAHLAPGSALGGDVRVGSHALIGIGARILPRQTIGAASTVGAGAVVVTEVPAQAVVTGVPARPR